MRVEPYTVGDYLHIYNRGNRKAKIIRKEKDAWRFMQALRFFNDVGSSQHILRDLVNANKKQSLSRFDLDRHPDSVFELGWPTHWPKQEPLIRILCYCLIPNHFHILVKEIHEGGVTKFMKKLGVGYTGYFNLQYDEVGRVFQGSFKAKTIKEDEYLDYLSVYIQVINILELFPGGSQAALKNIDKALEFAENYVFCSYRDFAGLRNSLIIDKEILGERFSTPDSYREFVYHVLKTRKYEQLGDLTLE